MQKAHGELLDEKIIFKKSKDIGRLYSKSRFGITIKNSILTIDLIEGAYLLEEEKIKIFEKDKKINFEELFRKSIKNIPNFEILYIVFRDLRKKGLIVKISDNKDFDFKILKNKKNLNDDNIQFFVKVFSERDIIDIRKIKKLIDESFNKNGILWFSIVDEEGDITYYDLSTINIKGENLEKEYLKINTILMNNRLLVIDNEKSKILFEEEFYGKPFGKGLQLSMVEALYLLEKDFLKIIDINNEIVFNYKDFKNFIKSKQSDIDFRFNVYKDLKKNGLIVKTGFKFGTHFRAYTKKPDKTHAEYLIQVVKKDFKIIWSDISRAIRLAHSVNKEFIFALYHNSKKIEYIRLIRLRP